MLQKYGRHGNPKYHHFRLGSDDVELQWESKGVRVGWGLHIAVTTMGSCNF